MYATFIFLRMPETTGCWGEFVTKRVIPVYKVFDRIRPRTATGTPINAKVTQDHHQIENDLSHKLVHVIALADPGFGQGGGPRIFSEILPT